jgi:hypothetical protein
VTSARTLTAGRAPIDGGFEAQRTDEAGVERREFGGLRFHDLRHSSATGGDGVPPKMVQRMMRTTAPHPFRTGRQK